MPPKKSKKKTSECLLHDVKRNAIETRACDLAGMSDGGELDVAQVARAYQLRNSALRMKLGALSRRFSQVPLHLSLRS